jgi:hypothetical protein
MAKLNKDLIATIMVGDEEVLFTLRRPENKELNEFLEDRYEVGRRNKIRDNSLQARIDFFDKLILKVETLEDEFGQITPERAGWKDAIPANWKSNIIFTLFESDEVSVVDGTKGVDKKK